jgi:hypothetical protein
LRAGSTENRPEITTGQASPAGAVFGSSCPIQPANNLVVSGSETIAL